MDLSALRSAVAEQVATSTEYLCYDRLSEPMQPPCVVVGRATVRPHHTFGAAGYDEAELGVWIIGKRAGAAAEEWLDEATQRVRLALEADRTFDDQCTTSWLADDGIRPGDVQIGDVGLPAVELAVMVLGAKPS